MSTDQPRDYHGRWTSGGSGSESGDHQTESPSTATRNVNGKNVPRSKVVTEHAGPSVGTDSGQSSRLSQAARDRIIRGKGTDQRHYPNRGPEATGATDLMRPMAGLTATPGRFKYQGRK